MCLLPPTLFPPKSKVCLGSSTTYADTEESKSKLESEAPLTQIVVFSLFLQIPASALGIHSCFGILFSVIAFRGENPRRHREMPHRKAVVRQLTTAPQHHINIIIVYCYYV